MGKRPYFPFYVGDWFKDPGVRALSLEAKGLLIDMLCLMHESDRRGYLQLGGKAITQDQLARMTGCSSDRIPVLVQELKTSGVCSCTDDGVIYSRRMVADDAKTRACSDAGRKGGGNPHLRATFKGHPKGDSKGDPKGISKHPSEYEYEHDSLKTSEGGSGETTPAVRPPLDLDPPVMGHWMDAARRLYAAYPRPMGERAALSAIAVALQVVEDRGEREPEAWLRRRVQSFAAAMKGKAMDYIPAPARWFADRRYDEDHAKVYGAEPVKPEMPKGVAW